MRYLLLASACLLAAPAMAHDKLDALLAEWDGLPSEMLVIVWGNGRRGESRDGNREHTYSVRVAGPAFRIGNYTAAQATSACSVVFEIARGTVLSSRVEAEDKRDERLCWREFKDNEAPEAPEVP